MTTANAQHLPNVEAPLLPVVAGELRPWKRGGPIFAHGIAKFSPQQPDRWIPGAQFRVVNVGLRVAYTVAVERYLPERRVEERAVLVRGGRYGKRWKPTQRARVIPEAVVVRVLAVEAIR